MAVAVKQKIKLEITKWFFDKPAVMRMVDRETAKRLSRVGALIRQIARRMIRKRKKASAPGSPPSSHTGLLRNNIFFAYDSARQTVAVGPVKLNQISYVFVGGGEGRKFIQGAAPSILEKGGLIGIRQAKNTFTGKWDRVPWGRKLKEKLIPVWLATPKEKSASVGVKTIVKGKHAINFYRVPLAIVSRIKYAKIAARPYMAPALMKARDNYADAFKGVTTISGVGD